MIGLPFNDLSCLGSITEQIADLVTNRDPSILELAHKYATTESLVSWIRGLPQRDDDGEPDDGPKIEGCVPVQRLRVPAEDPNCVERAALYLAVAELIDPAPVRQLATLDTEVGLHTFPVESGAPVILDPRVSSNCVDIALALAKDGPIAVDTREAIEWTARLAEAGAAPLRNGPGRVRRARNAVLELVHDGAAPADAATTEAIGWMLAVAEHVAQNYGSRALAVVRTTASAIAELADDALARARRKESMRNFALEIGGMRLEPPEWLSGLGRIAAHVGLDVGAIALKSRLSALGIGADMIGMVEQELKKEGLSLGPLARPSTSSVASTR